MLFRISLACSIFLAACGNEADYERKNEPLVKKVQRPIIVDVADNIEIPAEAMAVLPDEEQYPSLPPTKIPLATQQLP
jgi:hypothetical protein